VKEKPLHKVKIKPEPIWLRASYVGKYNGIRFRFEYKEYNNDEAEDVIKVFKFIWSGGKIPEDKSFAEEGIKVLFNKRLEANTIDFRVIKEDESLLIELSEDETDKVITEILENTEETDLQIDDDTIQER
jgi:hypothetical protein